MPVKLKFPRYAKLGQPRQHRPSKKLLAIFISLFLLTLVTIWWASFSGSKPPVQSKFAKILKNIPTTTPTPTPSPTPKPLTFSEMNALYGPCIHLPVLMYHRVQTKETAIANSQVSISVFTDYFEEQMQYLKDKGYNAITMQNLVDFFDNGVKIPAKSVLITFDDGYDDFYTDAYPTLQKFNFPATVFAATGLMNNPGYLSWDEITSARDLILFANHTWSHKNVGVDTKTMEYEILTADTQLSDHGVNSPKVFAYPYGFDTEASEKYLSSLGYKLAFTTASGSTLCSKKRLELPRIRIGNTQLSSYGF